MSLKEKRIVDPVLTELSLGFTPPGYIGTEIFQEVDVLKEAGKIPQFGKQAFREYGTERSIRAGSNRRNPDGVEPIDFTLGEHDIEAPIDYREKQEAAYDVSEGEVEANKIIMMQGLERAIAGIVTNPASYATGHTAALSGTDKLSDPACKPIDLAEAAKEKIRSAIGWRPEEMFISATSLSAMRTNPQILASLGTDSKKNQVPTIDDLKNLFGVKNIYVGDAVTAKDDDTFGDIWGDSWGFFFRRPTKSARTPNFGYTLKKRNSEFVDSYDENGGKIEVVRSTMIYGVKQTSGVAAFLYSETV